ncbi:MAG: hypothetical protein WDZ54_02075 [Sneathiella sp.]
MPEPDHVTTGEEINETVSQPPGIKHRELSHSDDLELIEIILPADFETHNVVK